MELQEIEYAAKIVYTICRDHPELCPHNYQLKMITHDRENNRDIETYQCIICGSRKNIEKPYTETEN